MLITWEKLSILSACTFDAIDADGGKSKQAVSCVDRAPGLFKACIENLKLHDNFLL